MVSIETLQEQFDELGFDPSREILDKCKFSPLKFIDLIIYFY